MLFNPFKHPGPRACAALLVGLAHAAADPQNSEPTKMKLESSAFTHHSEMPARFTCDGGDVSPPLVWSDLPEGAKSLVLIVDDPDAPDPQAPKMTWVHWVVYNLPAEPGQLPEGAATTGLPAAAKSGLNDWKKASYGGPCPPIGQHRYFHKLYALDTVLPDLGQPTKAKLEQAMQGHVLARAEMVGLYRRASK